STRSTTSATSTRPAKPDHSQGLPVVSIWDSVQGEDGRGRRRHGILARRSGDAPSPLRRRSCSQPGGLPWDRSIAARNDGLHAGSYSPSTRILGVAAGTGQEGGASPPLPNRLIAAFSTTAGGCGMAASASIA